MRIEHVAFNVADPLAMGRWYVEHLGFRVQRRTVEPPYMHFLVDDTGSQMIEIYKNPTAEVPNYEAIPVMTLHLALVSDDVDADATRLVQAGGKLDGEIVNTPTGDRMAFVRDPWGFTLQLVQRAEPMV